MVGLLLAEDTVNMTIAGVSWNSSDNDIRTSLPYRTGMGDSSASVPGESMLKDADFDASTMKMYLTLVQILGLSMKGHANTRLFSNRP